MTLAALPAAKAWLPAPPPHPRVWLASTGVLSSPATSTIRAPDAPVAPSAPSRIGGSASSRLRLPATRLADAQQQIELVQAGAQLLAHALKGQAGFANLVLSGDRDRPIELAVGDALGRLRQQYGRLRDGAGNQRE